MFAAFIVPIPLEGAGTICSNGFFFQTNSTDRYIHRQSFIKRGIIKKPLPRKKWN